MPSLAPPAELLLTLSRVLTALRVGWYVFGAQAVMYWGRPRLTEDIDVTVQLGAVETNRLVAELQQVGFAVRPEGNPAFIAQTRVVPLVFGNSGWALDIVTKVLAGRPKDLEDVRGVLLAQTGRLNLAGARHTLAMLEDALGVSDLIPVLDRLVSGDTHGR